MEYLQLKDTVGTWYLNNPVRKSGALKDNRLFRVLYDAYCKRNDIKRNYDDVIREGAYWEACGELFSWYEHRYAETFHMESGTKGQKRSVTRNTTEYTFDLLYCDDRQFKNYLLTGIPQSGSQDLFAFVLHTAVAFLVAPGLLDVVLQELGFHPLHVKNIHHLAICYVLLARENQPLNDDYNPFAEVKELYFQAIEILSKEPVEAAEGYSFGGQETRLIRKDLFLNKTLSNVNFEQLIQRNKQMLNMRHSKILQDFHKLISVFLYVFDAPASETEDLEPEDLSEYGYSFYAFVEQFCKDGLSRKKYREQVTGMIDRNGKHPTRNVLILLWLFAYCFSVSTGLPGIEMEKAAFNRIQKQLRKWDPQWAEAAKKYYYCGYFDVFAFCVDLGRPAGSTIFRGADVIAAINSKLSNDYGWGILNSRLPFDYYILKLEKLVVRTNKDGNHITVEYDGQRISIPDEEMYNIPQPLIVMKRMFTQLKEEMAEKSGDSSPSPLKCSLYEQL